MTTRRVVLTADDTDEVVAFNESLVDGFTCDPAVGVAPDPEFLERIFAALTVWGACEGSELRGWMATNDEGVIKWLVVHPAHLEAATVLLKAGRSQWGSVRGQVASEPFRDALQSIGCTVDGTSVRY